MRLNLRVVALGLVGVVIGIGLVLSLREATLSTHQYVEPDSRSVVDLHARSRNREGSQSLDEMVEAVLLLCRLEVNSDLVESEVHDVGSGSDADDYERDEGQYRAVFQPGLDQTNRRQLRGCLEDWTADQVLIDVVAITPG